MTQFKAFALIALVLLISLTFTQAQTCVLKPSFTPTKCTGCTVCTGSATSCCTTTEDDQIKALLALAQLGGASSTCVSLTKEYSCAACDPKNQVLITTNSLSICKSKCEALVSACQTPTKYLDCSKMPETNCWNSANQHIVGFGAVLICLISLILF